MYSSIRKIVEVLHRGKGGFISFSRKNPEKESGWENLGAVSIENFEAEFEKIESLVVGCNDVYFSVNTQHHPRRYGTRFGLYMSLQKETNTLFLNACFVDLDIYRLEGQMDVESALLKIKDLQDKKMFPPFSMYALSGRGIYLFWLLKSRNKGEASPKAHEGLIKQYKLVNKELPARLIDLAADTNTGSASQVLRVPGSVNSKSGREVHYKIVHNEDKLFEYTVDELISFLQITNTRIKKAIRQKKYWGRRTKKRGSSPKRQKGFIELNQKRLNDYYVLESSIGGWKKGHRQKALRFLAETLFRLKHPFVYINKEVLKSAGKCCPTYPSEPGDSIASIFSSLDLSKLISNDKLIKWLGVSTEIVMANLNRLETILPSVVARERNNKRRKEKREFTMKRREHKRSIVLEILKKRRVKSSREIQRIMKDEHGISMSRESIRRYISFLKEHVHVSRVS